MSKFEELKRKAKDQIFCGIADGEVDMKTNDTKVMTYTGESHWYVTNGKNYNITKIGNNAVEFIGDDGSLWGLAKKYFADPSEYRNKLESHIHNGTKHDQDKLKPSLLFNDFPHAIEEVLKVLKFGAEKYSEGNWLKVDNGVERYRNAAHRHMLAQEEFDDESGLLHLAHEATSVLMLLELKLREKRDAE